MQYTSKAELCLPECHPVIGGAGTVQLASQHRTIQTLLAVYTCLSGRGNAHSSVSLLQGWWSYEVCYMSHINQFHAEQNRLKEAHSLGVLHFLHSLLHICNHST